MDEVSDLIPFIQEFIQFVLGRKPEWKTYMYIKEKKSVITSYSIHYTKLYEEQITSVQQVSTSSADAIEEISKLIEEINEVSSAIAAAIQEQSAATEEIARNANEASKGTSEVSGNIISVRITSYNVCYTKLLRSALLPYASSQNPSRP